MTRNNWVPMPEFASLNLACSIVSMAFGRPCFLVGSAVERRDFRDVDIRMPLDEDSMTAFLGSDKAPIGSTAFGQYMAKVISADLSNQCGLRVDFQFQEKRKFDAERNVNDLVSVGQILGRLSE